MTFRIIAARLAVAAVACVAVTAGQGARAELPLPTFPDCGMAYVPDDCPSDLGQDWEFLSYIPDKYSSVRPEELALGTGIWADRAWATTTGSTEVIIAVLDCGIQWDNGDTRRKHYLNRGELLEPQDADGASTPGVWDLDGSGAFNIDDYALDPRVDPADGVDAADGHLDPSDLIHNPAFADGVDSDGNGYIDDISGWDFHWNDNDPYDDTRYHHGTFEAEASMAEGGDGGDIGVCPNCMILNVRTGDSFIMDGDNYGSGVIFSVDSGARVVQAASGCLGHDQYVKQAMAYAYDSGVALVQAAADETSFHHNVPATDPHALSVKAVRYDDDENDEITTFLNFSNCTNFGPRVDVSTSSTGCASGGTAMAAGAAGLVASAGLEAGLDPPLSTGEIYQLLMTTADDIDVPESRGPDADPKKYPSYPGFDMYFNHGRVNLAYAVEAVAAGAIPPEVLVQTPTWFEPIYADDLGTIPIEGIVNGRGGDVQIQVLWAPGGDPRDEDFVLLGTLDAAGGSHDGLLAELPVADVLAGEREAPRQLTPDDDNVTRALMAHGWMVNIRVHATDADGDVGIGRRTFSVIEDPDRRAGFPLDLGASAEGSPLLADIDGDGVAEIVIGTSDGLVHVLDGDGNPLPGWPASLDLLEEVDPDHAANHLGSGAFTSGAVEDAAHGAVLTAPAVDDLDGDGVVEIVLSTLRGVVHVLTPEGLPRDGFPVTQDPLFTEPGSTSPDRIVDLGFGSSPALGDLDGDGDLEIVIGAMDGHVYAWQDDGTYVDGWPVALDWEGPDQLPVARIVGTPALGDLDGDGELDVVVGTNEHVGNTYGLGYAVRGSGNLHPGGAYLEGWPVTLFGAFTAALPMVGEGTTASPALADLDGDGTLEVALQTIADPGMVLRYDGEPYVQLDHFEDQYGPVSNARSAALLHGVNSSTFADLDGDGVLDLINGCIDPDFGVGIVVDGKRSEFDHVLGAWSTADGGFIRGFPRQMEDIQFFMNPAVADIDDDGHPEVLNGSGGYFLHAFNWEGEEPSGWPKTTGGWITSSPAVNDLDGDGSLEVVVATRAGYLYVWDTDGKAWGNIQWSSFHHDHRNSGNVHVDLGLPDAPPPVEEPPAEDDGCECATASSSRASGVLCLSLGVAVLALRRWRS